MLLYLDLAYSKARAAGRMQTFSDLNAAIHEGAVRRVRPKAMTVGTTMIGLTPILWASSTDTGADVMKRIAAPMAGGLVTSFVLELTVYPAIFALWHRIDMEGWSALFRPPSRPEAGRGALRSLSPAWTGAGLVSVIVLAGTLGLAWLNAPAGSPAALTGPVFQRERQGGIEVALRHGGGAFRSGSNDFGIELRDLATGQPLSADTIDVGLFMPAMGAMQAMAATADVEPAGVGQWSGSIDVPMSGEWQVTVDIERPEGPLALQFSTVAR
jgi:hypothetical protein